jgi:hypothetical protein
MGRSTGAPLPRPSGSSGRWLSFIADEPPPGRKTRALHEDGNDRHRLRVEHDRHTLLLHLSDEDGRGWMCVAVDRATREWAVADGDTQQTSTTAAYNSLYRKES